MVNTLPEAKGVHMEGGGELRQALTHAAAVAWKEAQQTGNVRPEVEKAARLVDDALEALDTFGLDVRGPPPGEWEG